MDTPDSDSHLGAQARKAAALYGLARLGLFLALTVVIQGIAMATGAPVPLLISATLALIVAMPLSMFVFRGLRERAASAVALWDQQRKARKQWVKEELAKR